MKRRFTDEQIIGFLKEAESGTVMTGLGSKTNEGPIKPSA
jgi:hypothetical protein